MSMGNSFLQSTPQDVHKQTATSSKQLLVNVKIEIDILQRGPTNNHLAGLAPYLGVGGRHQQAMITHTLQLNPTVLHM